MASDVPSDEALKLARGLVDELLEAADGTLATMTYAPELPGADALVRALAAAASARIVQNLATGRAALEAATSCPMWMSAAWAATRALSSAIWASRRLSSQRVWPVSTSVIDQTQASRTPSTTARMRAVATDTRC